MFVQVLAGFHLVKRTITLSVISCELAMVSSQRANLSQNPGDCHCVCEQFNCKYLKATFDQQLHMAIQQHLRSLVYNRLRSVSTHKW